jgi:hypothetical protein
MAGDPYLLVAQDPLDVPAASEHAQNQHVVCFDSIEDHVVADREGADAM